ncbi:MMPL family transporter [Nonomuraea thailandensis]
MAAAVVLLFAFRSLIAAAVPLVVGVIGVACGVALFTLLGHVVGSPGFAVYLTIMLGLGVGIDYALLIVTRFRSALGRSRRRRTWRRPSRRRCAPPEGPCCSPASS